MGLWCFGPTLNREHSVPHRERGGDIPSNHELGFGGNCESVGPLNSDPHQGAVPNGGVGVFTGLRRTDFFLMEGELQVADRLRGCGQVTLFGLCLSALLRVELLERIDFRGVQWLSSCHS